MLDKCVISKQKLKKILFTMLIFIIIAGIATAIWLSNSVIMVSGSVVNIQSEGVFMLAVYFVGFSSLLAAICTLMILLAYAVKRLCDLSNNNC